MYKKIENGVRRLRSPSASSELTVYYWLEPVVREGTDWFLFTAVCRSGLVMSGLARCAEEKERNFQALAIRLKRYLPGFRLEQKREANLEAINEFKEYLQGQRRQFTLKRYPLGTAFQRKVWQELEKIPYGETCSYSDIARRVDCPQGQRAISE